MKHDPPDALQIGERYYVSSDGPKPFIVAEFVGYDERGDAGSCPVFREVGTERLEWHSNPFGARKSLESLKKTLLIWHDCKKWNLEQELSLHSADRLAILNLADLSSTADIEPPKSPEPSLADAEFSGSIPTEPNKGEVGK